MPSADQPESSSTAAARKFRPPQLALSPRPAFAHALPEIESPIESPDGDDSSLGLSSPSSTTSTEDEFHSGDEGSPDEDDLSKDLKSLSVLRKRLATNLRLRPIKSTGNLAQAAQDETPSTVSTSNSRYAQRSPSPVSPSFTDGMESARSSIYFTPTSEYYPEPLSAHYLGFTNPASSNTNGDAHHTPRTPSPRQSHPIPPAALLAQRASPTRPLLIDTRPAPAFLSCRLAHAVNLAIPTLILKRCRNPKNAFHDIDALRQYLTTDDARDEWDDLLGPGGMWDGDVIVYDDDMDERDRPGLASVAWALLPVLAPLLTHGSADWLEGGLAAVRADPALRRLLVTEDAGAELTVDDPRLKPMPSPGLGGKKGGGLFQLDTGAASRSRRMPQLDNGPDRDYVPPPAPSPLPIMSSRMSSQAPKFDVHDASPSPPPSQATFSRPAPPSKRPSLPSLRKLDTKSAERLNMNLPKLQVRTLPHKSLTLAVPPSAISLSSPDAAFANSLRPPRSPTHLLLTHSNHSPPASAFLHAPASFGAPRSPGFRDRSASPHRTPRSRALDLPPTPTTARQTPDTEQPPSTEDAFPEFAISVILPGFLFLGPEPTSEEHVQGLLDHGVKRILNMAFECDDDAGLRLRERFEKYSRIAMRDTVEEDNITRGVREACELLDDARLHSAPTYVHCKAGKSRSVTAVMAYLIHANRWTLSRAYDFVKERRKGISPNIGFVSELMVYEEQELGGKSKGVVQPSSAGAAHDADERPPSGAQGNYGVSAAARRPAGMRESLPPVYSRTESDGVQALHAAIESAGQDMETRDAEGRYRHVRRAPVDEHTLQPMRRVSKAGLESSWDPTLAGL